MRLRIIFLILCLVVGSGCSSNTSPIAKTPSSSPSPSPSTSPSPTPNPTVQVGWFWSNNDKESPLFRFVALIQNPGKKPLEGLKTEWIAYDANNTIVGSFKGERPVVPPGSTIPYVGGAGGLNLSGVPARADVRIVEAGHFVETFSPAFAVSDLQLKRQSKSEYTVKARVTTGSEEVASADLTAYVVLKNAAGTIVGGDFWDPERLPERVPPGTAFTMEVSFIRVTEQPASAEIFATEGP